MGWSCRADAARTMHDWSDACYAATGSSNVFEANGSRYFFETSRTEHRDGAITGSVYKTLIVEGDSIRCRKSGSFRIEGDGTVTRAPAWLKKVTAKKAA